MNEINNTQDTIKLIERVAADSKSAHFVWLSITVYFERVIEASEMKLAKFGLRPIVAPICAEMAMARAAHARSFHDFLVKLVGEDALAAELALRAVRLYAHRFAMMANPAISAELASELRIDVNSAACSVWRNLEFIDPETSALTLQIEHN